MAQTITAVASLLWPLLVLLMLVLFRRPLSRVVRSAEQREWSLEVGGQRLTMNQLSDQQNAMIADLQEQVNELHRTVAQLRAERTPWAGPSAPPSVPAAPVPPPQGMPAGPAQEEPPAPALPRQAPPPAGPTPASPGPPGAAPWGSDVPDDREQSDTREAPVVTPNAVLWVDDNPENNALIVDQLQRDGVRVDLARTTQEGLTLLGSRRYGIVLSDMGRLEHGDQVPDAGLRLLRAVRETDTRIPFVIYCSNRARDAYRVQALTEGATAITASPTVVTEQLRAAGLL